MTLDSTVPALTAYGDAAHTAPRTFLTGPRPAPNAFHAATTPTDPSGPATSHYEHSHSDSKADIPPSYEASNGGIGVTSPDAARKRRKKLLLVGLLIMVLLGVPVVVVLSTVVPGQKKTLVTTSIRGTVVASFVPSMIRATAVRLHPLSSTLFAADEGSGVIGVYAIPTGNLLRSLNAHSLPVLHMLTARCPPFLLDGTSLPGSAPCLYTFGTDNRTFVWRLDTDSTAPVAQFSLTNRLGLNGGISPDGQYLFYPAQTHLASGAPTGAIGRIHLPTNSSEFVPLGRVRPHAVKPVSATAAYIGGAYGFIGRLDQRGATRTWVGTTLLPEGENGVTPPDDAGGYWSALIGAAVDGVTCLEARDSGAVVVAATGTNAYSFQAVKEDSSTAGAFAGSTTPVNGGRQFQTAVFDLDVGEDGSVVAMAGSGQLVFWNPMDPKASRSLTSFSTSRQVLRVAMRENVVVASQEGGNVLVLKI
ncbi:hypothetical protein HDU96_004844 [Phlyctochytrium bullatum]|nr:hypothetical protein HDU96_004844 [Phlyctochytrium bullatum]